MVETKKGTEVKIEVIQPKGQEVVEVVKIEPYIPFGGETIVKENKKTVKKVTEFGVTVEFTNDKKTLATNTNINTVVTEIVNMKPELRDYEVVSSQSKDFIQHQEQVIIMTNGQRTVQMTGHLDHKTLRYIPLEEKEIPVDVCYPIINQKTIPIALYPTIIKRNKPLQVCEKVLLAKFKIFKNRVPAQTTLE